MPTLTEQLDAVTAKLDSLLAVVAAEPAAETKTVSAGEALEMIADELSKENLPKERVEYLKSVIAEIKKNNWEATTSVQIKVLVDPWQVQPKTEVIGTLETVAAASPESGFASNMSAVQKIALIQKLLTNPVELKKSAISDKLDEIQTLFGFTDKDMTDSYDISWKVSDLVRLLQNAAKIETIIGKSDSAPAKAEKAAATPPEPQPVWPRDMASAKFDPIKKSYEPEQNVWGSDSKA